MRSSQRPHIPSTMTTKLKAPKRKAKAKSKSNATPNEKTPDVRRFRGKVTWIHISGEEEGTYERYEVTRAIFRDGRELIIDCNCAHPGAKPYIYTVNLFRTEPFLFRGQWSVSQNSRQTTGTCSCRLYDTGDRLALVGVWNQAGNSEEWFSELFPVDSFSDEEAS